MSGHVETKNLEMILNINAETKQNGIFYDKE